MENIYNVEVGEIVESEKMFTPLNVMNLKVKSEFGCTEKSVETLMKSFTAFIDVAKDGTYCLIARQKNTASNNLLANELKKLETVDYNYMQNTNKIIFSACKQNGQVKTGFLQK